MRNTLKRTTIALIGNPNCGKTTLFNALTGSKQRVGNWPGVTVEKKSGEFRHANKDVEVIDLPGTYSLDTDGGSISLDEMVARNFAQSGCADIYVNIIDASNLERSLYLTSQLLEMGIPLLVALNMSDVAQSQGIQIDSAMLSAQLGCPVISIVASRGVGIDALKEAITQETDLARSTAATAPYPDVLQDAIKDLEKELKNLSHAPVKNRRWFTIRLLEGDLIARNAVGTEVAQLAENLALSIGEDIDLMIADARYQFANTIHRQVAKQAGHVTKDLTEQIDRIVLHRALGIPIFLFLMYLMFLFTINMGGAFIDFFDQSAEAIFVEGFGHLLQISGSPEWLVVLLANGIGGGIQTVATFIPIIGFLYLFLSVLEDSGYMARAAFVMDRFMRWVGLPGKSFVPLIVGFGCNVPAIMATRTLENRRDRLMTIAMAPFMSCGARLPVYVLFAAAFFPTNAQNIVFGLYLIGIVMAVLTGLALKHTILRGDPTPFIMELPAYHLPTFKGIGLQTWNRLKGFLVRAGRVIVPMVLVLNFMNAVGTDGSFGHEDSENSVLAALGKTIAPAFAPFGLNAENWPAAVGIFTGVLAKEAVVGTLNATYSSIGQAQGSDRTNSDQFDLKVALADALATIPVNLSDAAQSWLDPLGIQIGDLSDQHAVAEREEVSQATFGAMAERFNGAAGAFAYLLFILLYFPCTAATAAVYQESGSRWSLFVVAWTTGLAYGVATIWYQASQFVHQPALSTIWIGLCCLLISAGLWFMHRQATTNARATKQNRSPSIQGA